jgi:phage-related protein
MNAFLKNKLDVIFYHSNAKNEPVRDWLKSLSREDKKTLGEDIKTVQFGWPLGMPIVRSLGGGLWEIRSCLKSRRIARVIFFMMHHTIFLLHGFIKKSQKTLNSDINLALQRKKEIEREMSYE